MSTVQTFVVKQEVTINGSSQDHISPLFTQRIVTNIFPDGTGTLITTRGYDEEPTGEEFDAACSLQGRAQILLPSLLFASKAKYPDANTEQHLDNLSTAIKLLPCLWRFMTGRGSDIGGPNERVPLCANYGVEVTTARASDGRLVAISRSPDSTAASEQDKRVVRALLERYHEPLYGLGVLTDVSKLLQTIPQDMRPGGIGGDSSLADVVTTTQRSDMDVAFSQGTPLDMTHYPTADCSSVLIGSLAAGVYGIAHAAAHRAALPER